MHNDRNVLYDRWFASKASLVQELLQKQSFFLGTAPASGINRLFESASRHVFIQSDDFYKSLRMAHQGDSSADNIIGFLFNDLRMLRVALFTFGERYLGDRPAGITKIIPAELNQLTESVAQRITLEENLLAPLLKRA